MEIKEYIEYLRKVKPFQVELSRFELKEIPEEIFQFTWIENLILGLHMNYHIYEFEGKRGCKLRTIPNEIIKLKNLKSLSLSGTPFGGTKPEIEDFEILRELKSLEFLDLTNTKLKNIEFVNDLDNLKHLQIGLTEIKDYSPLKSKTDLISLTIGDNEIESLDFIKDLNNLEALSLTTNKLTTLNNLEDKSKLKRLCICNNEIKDYTKLKHLKSLEIYCNGSVKHRIEDLEHNTKLLEFSTEKIDQRGLNKLSNFIQLGKVDIWNYEGDIVDISPLKNVAEIQIYGSFNKIIGLERLNKVVSIHISSPNLHSLYIPYKRTLKKIGVPECQVPNFDFYEDFTNIEAIDVGHTNIEDLSPIAELTKLKRLYFGKTRVKTLKPILSLVKNNIELHFTECEGLEELSDKYYEDGSKAIIDYYKKYDR